MKKFVFLLSIPLIAISCSKEEANNNSSIKANQVYRLAGPGDADCRTLDLAHDDGCSGPCYDCGPTVTVYPNSISGLDYLAANGSSGDISAYFSGSEWVELFPDFLEDLWSGVYNAIINGECDNIEKHELANATVYVFHDFSGNVMFAKPFVINE
jgi:hypothetical protein